MSREVARLRTMAKVLDELIRIPGTNLRVGLDPLLGILPGGGDAVGGVISGYTIVVAGRLGAPPSVIARMLLNVLVDMAVGTIPFLGDLFDIGWKANRRNVTLLEGYLEKPGRARTSSRIVVLLALLVLAALVIASISITVWLIDRVFSLF